MIQLSPHFILAVKLDSEVSSYTEWNDQPVNRLEISTDRIDDDQ